MTIDIVKIKVGIIKYHPLLYKKGQSFQVSDLWCKAKVCVCVWVSSGVWVTGGCVCVWVVVSGGLYLRDAPSNNRYKIRYLGAAIRHFLYCPNVPWGPETVWAVIL